MLPGGVEGGREREGERERERERGGGVREGGGGRERGGGCPCVSAASSSTWPL